MVGNLFAEGLATIDTLLVHAWPIIQRPAEDRMGVVSGARTLAARSKLIPTWRPVSPSGRLRRRSASPPSFPRLRRNLRRPWATQTAAKQSAPAVGRNPLRADDPPADQGGWIRRHASAQRRSAGEPAGPKAYLTGTRFTLPAPLARHRRARTGKDSVRVCRV